jgi:hypothetical protein
MLKPRRSWNSPLKGVSWHKKSQKWQAQIRSDNKSIYLGTYDRQEDAYFAYCEAALKLHGEFANLG